MPGDAFRRGGPGLALRTVMAAGVGALLGVAPGAAAVAGTPAGPAANHINRTAFVDGGAVLRLRAAAIEPELDVPDPLVPGAGYSHVYLEHGPGSAGGCKAVGAGVYARPLVQEDVVYSGPPSPARRDGLYNPTEARDSAPDLSERRLPTPQRPQLRSLDGAVISDVPSHGGGPHWQARCARSMSGQATGTTLDVAGARAAGSTVTGHVDPKTGRYVGIARAFVAGLTTKGGVVDLIFSAMQVTATPRTEPRLTYRIAVNSDTLATGRDVPAPEFTAQFNEAINRNAATVGVLGPLGLTLLGPTVSESEHGHRRVINAPFLELNAGLHAREGIGHNNHLRLINVDFDGLYAPRS